MLLIDKSQEETRFILTLTENTTITSPEYLLVLHSDYTNKTYRFQLPANTSAYTFRFDEFIMDTTIFNNMEIGTYNYSVYQSAIASLNETTMGEPIELGLLKVINPTTIDETFISIEANEADDDFVVYNG